MNSSITNNIQFNISGDIRPQSSSVYRTIMELSPINISHIYCILAYMHLKENWDSYGANAPSDAAIVKANIFISQILNPKGLEVFFTAPTPDGDILVELRHNQCSLEFIFSGDADDRIVATCGNEHYTETILNETTFYSYLNWLYC